MLCTHHQFWMSTEFTCVTMHYIYMYIWTIMAVFSVSIHQHAILACADFLIKHFLKFLWQLHMASHTSLWFSCNSTPNFWALFYSLSLFSFFCCAVWVRLLTLSLFSVISSLVCRTALRISINVSLWLVFSSLVSVCILSLMSVDLLPLTCHWSKFLFLPMQKV